MEQTVTVATPDFSIYGLVMHADPVVKGVLVLLVLASIGCWAIIFEKAVRLFLLRRNLRRLKQLQGRDDVDPHSEKGLVRAIFAAEQEEATLSDENETPTEARARLERGMRVALKTYLQRVEIGLSFLATVGSAAPFVGLFGTVWGIVNSFTSIAQQKDTSLAVVAPGIAEALIATALGLAAAIPAVVAYNQIAVALGRAAQRAGDSITEIAKREVRRHQAAVAGEVHAHEPGASPMQLRPRKAAP